MRRKALDLVLLIVIGVGGYLAWTSGQERATLAKEYARLARTSGDLAVGDPTKVHLLALETDEPLHFAWRVDFPANYPVRLTSRDGHQSTSSSSSPTEAIIRLRFREKDGILQVYTKGPQGSSRSGIGDARLADLLRGRWDEIEVEQLGADDVVVVSPDEQVSLIKLVLPEAMQSEGNLSEWTRKQFFPVFFELKLGTAKP